MMRDLSSQLVNFKSKKHSSIFLIVLLLATGILSIYLIKPFLSYIFLAFLLAYISKPVYNKLNSKFNAPKTISIILVVFIFLLIIVPASLLLIKVTSQTVNIFSIVDRASLELFSESLAEYTGINFDATTFLKVSTEQIKSVLSMSAMTVLASLTNVVVGLFIMFFLTFYLLIDGEEFVKYLKAIIPLKKSQVEALFNESKEVTSAVLYGQMLTAAAQGIVGGIGFYIFGLPNPIFWGFLMGILSLLPILGTAIIWLPFSIFLLMQGHMFAGIGILLYSAILTSNIDNVLKPKLISTKSNVHPTLVLLGVFGGIHLFGFVGILAGPLILALLMVLLKFYHEES